MGKKQRKINIPYTAAIVLGVILGIALCVFAFSVAMEMDKPQLGERLYDETYHYGYNVRLLPEALAKNETNLFYEIESINRNNFSVDKILEPIWTEDVYLSIPSVFFRDCLNEELSDWEFIGITYQVDGDETGNVRIVSAEYRYRKFTNINNNPTTYFRDIEIIPGEARLSMNDVAYDREMLWKNPDMNELKMSYDKAIALAEESGARQFRMDHDIKSWRIDLQIDSDAYWYVRYNADGYYEFFRAGINSETGEIKIHSENNE